MNQLFLSIMREFDPELSPELFIHSSSFIKAAIKILKNVHGTSGREIKFNVTKGDTVFVYVEVIN